MSARVPEAQPKSKLVRFIQLLQTNWTRADISSKAAEMAYFVLLSLFPLMLIFVNIIPLLPLPQNEILGYLRSALPGNVYDVLKPVLDQYLNSASGGAISIGIVTSLWSASTVIATLKEVLNKIYGVKAKENVLVSRLLSLGVMLLIVFVMGAFVFIGVFGRQMLGIVESFIGIKFPFLEGLLALRLLLLLPVLFTFFLIVYQFVPDHELKCKYALPGAGFATIAWLALTQFFSLYISLAGGEAATNATFGGFIVLMLFLYLAGMMTLLGALINTIYFEWINRFSVQEFDQRIQKKKELEQEGTTEYPKEDTVLLRRKIVKVRKLKPDEIERLRKQNQTEQK